MTPRIRLAAPADAAAINDIYNYYVPRSTCTYQEEPEPLAARVSWLAAKGPEHPVTVAEAEGRVVGWGCLTTFRARSAYRYTCEDSLYVHHALHGRGIGAAILADLVARARALGYRAIIAGIDAEQPVSIRLHARQGFVEVGRLPQVGYKFGRWLDVVFMELLLPDGGPEVGGAASVTPARAPAARPGDGPMCANQ
ncbi:MAG: N-acetyltransferase [Phycisphaerales bacterium]|nr:N-acetyltransferase [Phycisphaerales bacterium]